MGDASGPMPHVTPALGTSEPGAKSLVDARSRLGEPRRSDPVVSLLVATALLAVSAIALATAVIVGPYWQARSPSATTASSP